MLYIVKKTLDTTVESKNHYLVCVKKNRMVLFNKMEENTRDEQLKVSSFESIQKNRGRIETRSVHVFKVSDDIKKGYSNSSRVILVNRKRIVKGKESNELVYYLSDLEVSAEKFSEGIRGHWSIENRLHYVKDVVMNEDKANMKNKLIAPILSVLRSFVIMIAYVFCNSVISFQRTYSHNLDILSIL